MQNIQAYQGVPSRICVCTVINHAKIPKHVEAAIKTIKIQMLSCNSGH